MKLYPRCHPEWIDEPPIDKRILKRGLSYTATGYLLPCCWCDYSGNTEFAKLGMFDEELKLENNKSVKSVLLSKQWVNFHKIILLHPDQAPNVCKTRCSKAAVEEELKND